MPSSFSSKFRLLLHNVMKSVKKFQYILRLTETIISILMFYFTRKKISFI